MRDHKNLSTTHGFSLLELLLAVAMMAIVIVGIAGIVSRQGDDAKANVVALQLKTVGNAASEYIKDNYSTISTNLPVVATSKVVVTIPMLTASGYLSQGFNASNAFGQKICVVVRKSAAAPTNLLGLVVTEGGTAIDDLSLGQISATIGEAGGGVYRQNPAQVTGALGSWAFATNIFAGVTTTGTNCGGAGNIALTAGHPTMSLWFADGASRSASGTLYRNAVAGQPELNTMNTALLTAGPAIIPDTQIGKPCNAGSAPNILGAIATAQDGSVVSCVNNVWTKVENKFWGAPADTIAALGTCDASKVGATRMVKSTGGAAFNTHPYVPYTCNGTGTWKPIAIDQSGNFDVAGNTQIGGNATIAKNLSVAQISNFYDDVNINHASDLNISPGSTSLQTEGLLNLNRYMSFQNQAPAGTIGTACNTIANGKAVTMTTEGKLISCQNGIWALATTPDIGTTIYLYGYDQWAVKPCPSGWKEIGADYVYAETSDKYIKNIKNGYKFAGIILSELFPASLHQLAYISKNIFDAQGNMFLRKYYVSNKNNDPFKGTKDSKSYGFMTAKYNANLNVINNAGYSTTAFTKSINNPGIINVAAAAVGSSPYAAAGGAVKSSSPKSYFIRTCSNPTKQCQVAYLRAKVISTSVGLLNCPAGWIEAGAGSIYSDQSGKTVNHVKTCMKCPD